MTNDEKKMLQNPTEYYWEEVKDYYLEIWFPIDYRDRNPFKIDIVTSIDQINGLRLHLLHT